jgi:general L-amino acid transport system permease protein
METTDTIGTSSMEKPPITVVGPIGWLRQNLFSSWLNALLTIFSVAFLYVVGRGVLQWAFHEANWMAVTSNLSVLVWGRYPRDQVWRLGTSLGIVVSLGLVTWWAWKIPDGKRARRGVQIGWLLSIVAVSLLLRGFTLPTPITIGNNLGYYISRPDVLLLLDETWRAYAGVIIVGIAAGLTWGEAPRRNQRILAGLAIVLMVALLFPLGLQLQEYLPGLKLPLLVPLLSILAIAFLIGRSVGKMLASVADVRRWLFIVWILTLPFLILILTTFDVGVERTAPAEILPIVEPQIWSGILLTLTLAIVSIVASFPIGVLLALGRRSSLPIVKVICVLFIEVVRGVPLITVLFMAQVMFPLFLPLEVKVDRVVRAMAGRTLFTAAYLAEIVRGGLQAVRHEQVEAARALGLSEVLVTGLVVLPQALRAVIPPIMGQFVSMFKDTSLVAIVGLLDLIAIGQSVIKQREFLGAVREVYLFAGLFYFFISYAMSYASRRLEKQLGVGER